MRFKSKIPDSLVGLIPVHILLVFVAVLINVLTGFQISEIHSIYAALLCPYLVGIYIYAGLFNNDILINDTRIEIINNVPFFRKRISFDYSTIKRITLRHDWIETFGKEIDSSRLWLILIYLKCVIFPFNYKWIKISTDRDYKFYCFGIDVDAYINPEPIFEDVYKLLRAKHKFVNWTNETNAYYAGLKKMADNDSSPQI